MAHRSGRRVTCEDVDHVRLLIEHCLLQYMSKEEAVETICKLTGEERIFIDLVWERLQQDNREFFLWYGYHMWLKSQIEIFNGLFEWQVDLMVQTCPAGAASIPISKDCSSIRGSLGDQNIHVGADSFALPTRMNDLMDMSATEDSGRQEAYEMTGANRSNSSIGHALDTSLCHFEPNGQQFNMQQFDCDIIQHEYLAQNPQQFTLPSLANAGPTPLCYSRDDVSASSRDNSVCGAIMPCNSPRHHSIGESHDTCAPAGRINICNNIAIECPYQVDGSLEAASTTSALVSTGGSILTEMNISTGELAKANSSSRAPHEAIGTEILSAPIYLSDSDFLYSADGNLLEGHSPYLDAAGPSLHNFEEAEQLNELLFDIDN